MSYWYKGYTIKYSSQHGCWFVYRNDRCYGSFSTAQDAEEYILGRINAPW